MIAMIVKQAFQSLLANPARSLLTVLGVVIGISSVVMFMALGEGLRRDIKSEVTSLGSNLLIVLPGQIGNSQQFSPNLISGDILKPEDVTAIRAIPEVEEVSPMMLVLSGVLKRGETPAPQAMTLGVEPSFERIFSTISIGAGRYFTDEENTSKARVIVLGETTSKTLFGNEDGLGQEVTIGKETFTVIGLTDTPQQTSLIGGTDYGTMNIVPIETAGQLASGVSIMRILISVRADADIDETLVTIRETLLARHAQEDFSVVNQEDILSLLDTILTILTAAIIAIASISLVVAGVGIMNIMLVAVTERTREIGLRKAIGASNGSILFQFLVEAIFLTVTGAILALGLVFLAAILVPQVAPIHLVITSQAVGLAVGVAILVGTIFGLAPAMRAARLDPIKALRYE